MLSPIPSRFFKQIGSGLSCWIIFGGAAAALAPALIPLYVTACATIIWRSVRVAYVSDRFVEFSSLAMLNWLAVCPLLSLAIGITLFERLMGMPSLQAIALALAPAALSTIGYQIAKKARGHSPFKVRDGKVAYADKMKSSPASMALGGICAALGATAASYLGVHNKAQVAFWLYVFFCLIGLYYIYFLRHAIAGIQELKSREKQLGHPLESEEIDSIRTLRIQSWLGRRFSGVRK